MYLGSPDEDQLNGWFSRIFRPIAHVAAAVFTGGASIPLSASIELQRAQAKKAEEAAKQQQAEYDAMVKQVSYPAGTTPPGVQTMVPGTPFPVTTPGTIVPQAQTPAWMAPAAIGAGAVALIALLTSRSRR